MNGHFRNWQALLLVVVLVAAMLPLAALAEGPGPNDPGWVSPFAPLPATTIAARAAAVSADAATPGVEPKSVTGELYRGQSLVVDKTVQTPPIPPKPDIYFLADTTGSMGGAIGSVQSDAALIMAQVLVSAPDAQFGAGEYKDFPYDAFAFRNNASIGTPAAAQAGINLWVAGGGNDGSEGQLFAFDQIADGAPVWRSGSSKILVWFGDMPGHDPVCAAISGLAHDITETSATGKLVGAGIQVLAIDIGGLNADPTLWSEDYISRCAVIDGLAGQASRITGATGGALYSGVNPADVAAAIVAGLENLPAIVTPVLDAACSSDLAISFSPTSLTVNSGDAAVFQETVMLKAGTTTFGPKTCTVHWLVNGVSNADFDQTITIEAINRPPDCSKAAPSQGTIWPPNHKFVPITVLGVTDPDGDPVTIKIAKIYQDEPLNTTGDGNFVPDGQGLGTSTAEVRAERVGTPKVPGNGRFYHIFFTATDLYKATCWGEVKVSVPHDQDKEPVDGGPLYKSTLP